MTIIRDILSGEIHLTWCTITKPPKDKYHTFLEHGHFFLINSKYRKNSIELKRMDYPFLSKDVSHLNYSLLYAYPTNNSLQPNSIKGNLKAETIEELKDKIPFDEVLTPEQQKKVIQCLDSILFD